MNTDATDRNTSIPLIGCGILKDEIDYLIKKNGWDLSAHYLDSSLHVDFERLEYSLTHALRHFGSKPKTVFYGTCHPLMNRFMRDGNAVRTEGQNCVEILLGKDLFTRCLTEGSFFLMEDWARHWDRVMTKAFGDNPEVIRDIFQSEHKQLLALRTVCSGDYGADADRVSRATGLPLKWMDAGLDHLEAVLKETLGKLKGLEDE